jgi:GR25 family glycosyltransferase involved in LPS biosynthesis
MDNIYHVYCINLHRRYDRLEQFLGAFPKAWFSKLKLHGATDGQNYTLTAEDRVRLRNADWNVETGRGCRFSHEAVWRNIVKNENKYAIILEDDAVYNGSTTAGMDTFIAAFIKSDARLCFLGPINHSTNTQANPHNFTDIVVPSICRISSNLGSMSYIITLQGAKDLLAVIDNRGHYWAVDQLINDYMKQRNAWICSAPPLFKVNSALEGSTKHVDSLKQNIRSNANVQIFIIFHKYIVEDCYKNIPEDILYKYFTFVAVNKSIPKTYPTNLKKYKIVNEWDLPIHDPTFQERGYLEQSVIYHVYANELHKIYDYVGFFQYDMVFNNNIVNFFNNNISQTETHYFALEVYNFDYCHYKTGCEPSTLDFVIRDYEKFYGVDFDRTAAFPLWNSFILPTQLYAKIMPWITQLYSKMWPWCVSPPNQTHYRHLGGIYERIMAYAISQERMPFVKVDVVHDHDFKDMTQRPDVSDDIISLAYYTYFYGTNNNLAYKIPPIPSEKYKCYYYSNNAKLLAELRDTNWIGIYDNKPTNDDLIESCMAGKHVKTSPHTYKELKDYDYLCYFDNKLPKINETFVENSINKYFVQQNYAILLRQHEFLGPDVWQEFYESMKQQRYVLEQDKYKTYIETQISLGLRAKIKTHSQGGFIIRNMKHENTPKINNTWYKHIQMCGIQDQISFFFVKQLFIDSIHDFTEYPFIS